MIDFSVNIGYYNSIGVVIMFTTERFNIILEELKKKGIVSVTDLVKMLLQLLEQ